MFKRISRKKDVDGSKIFIKKFMFWVIMSKFRKLARIKILYLNNEDYKKKLN